MKVKTKKTMSSMKKTIDVPNGSYDFIIDERYFQNIISFEIANLLGQHPESKCVLKTAMSIKKKLLAEFEVSKRQ